MYSRKIYYQKLDNGEENANFILIKIVNPILIDIFDDFGMAISSIEWE